MDNPRRIGVAAAATLAVFIGVAHVTADRQWLTGTWVKVGIKRTPFVGDAVNEQFPPGPLKKTAYIKLEKAEQRLLVVRTSRSNQPKAFRRRGPRSDSA